MINRNEIRVDFNNNIRNIFLEKHPFCQYCGLPAEHVHHLIPIAAGGDNRESNLIPLCLKCHGIIEGMNYSSWKEKQRIGIEKAKKEGKFKGGKIKKINKEKYLKLKMQYFNHQITKSEFAIFLNVSRPTLNKILKEEEKYLL